MPSSLDHDFGAYQPLPPRYKGTVTRSYYVTMRDGVKIAVQVTLPGNLDGDRIPTLLSQTRYWRAIELNPPFRWFLKPEYLNLEYLKYKPFFTSHGYALVSVDVRGTGASTGVWPYPWHADSIGDAGEIVDWIVAQPWSNGAIVGYGGSYVGITAELLPVCQHSAVKAVLPMFAQPDAYSDIGFPGGIYNQRFISEWEARNLELDQNIVPKEMAGSLGRLLVRGVAPVDDDRRREILRAAVIGHAGNGAAFAHAHEVVCRDDVLPGLDVSVEDITVHHYAQAIAQAAVPVGGWGSWMDAGTADAVLRRFMTFDNAEWAVIGAWEHGGRFQASPYLAPRGRTSPSLAQQWREMMSFFDVYLKGVDNGVRGQKTLWYYTMGEERWKKTHTWPLPGTTTTRWYLADDHRLSLDAPTVDGGADVYKVDFEATTGDYNRWWELSGLYNKTVFYPRRAEAGRHLLTYTSPPLPEDTEITGYPVVTLYVTSSETDGAFYVYLEDVAPDGRVTYVTDGQLRAIHRKVSTDTPPYKLLVPYHSFKRKDVMPLLPGEVAELTFGLLLTSVLIGKGHRLRLGIAGHDNGTFLRIPATGTPVITVARSQRYASHIDLPVVPRG